LSVETGATEPSNSDEASTTPTEPVSCNFFFQRATDERGLDLVNPRLPAVEKSNSRRLTYSFIRLTKETQSPWFWKAGFVKVFQPSFLHWSISVGTCGVTAIEKGPFPTGTLAVTVFVGVLITDTEWLLKFVT